VEGLSEDGWLAEEAKTASAALGRRPTPLVFDSHRLVLLGAHINGERSRVVASTLAGEVFELNVLSTEGRTGEQVLEILAEQIVGMQRRFLAAGRRVCGIGVAVPGPVDPVSGELRFSESTGWTRLPVKLRLLAAFLAAGLPDLPVIVDRAANCIALQHAETNRLELSEALLYVHVGQSVAVSAMLHDRLMRGRHGLAGYVAHQSLQLDGPLCSCGRTGCVHAMLTLEAVRREMGLAKNILPASLQSEIRAAIQAGESSAGAALQTLSRHLGTFIFNLCQTYDPGRVFVGGVAFQLGGDLVTGMRERLEELYAGSGVQVPHVQVMRVDVQTAAQGAAASVMRELLSLESALPVSA
jgi:predicted NBD/HSP70 family sugar kinase